MEKNYIVESREIDLYIGHLLNNTNLELDECKEEFLKRYPNKGNHFDIFVEDYVS